MKFSVTLTQVLMIIKQFTAYPLNIYKNAIFTQLKSSLKSFCLLLPLRKTDL